MKTILIPTDFSKGANHAAQAAVWFAEQLHARLLLWNCRARLPVMPAYLGGPKLAEIVVGTAESQEVLEKTVQRLEDFITHNGGEYRPQVLTRYSEGDFKKELLKQLAEEPVELIVIGAPAGCLAEHIFTGSHTLQVIEAAKGPVLIVPSRSVFYQLDKVVFATDYDPGDLIPIRYMSELSQKLAFKIEVVHVIVNRTKEHAHLAQKEVAFTQELSKLNNPAISTKQIRGKQVVSRLNLLSKQTGADMLAMSHHHYSFFKRMFSEPKVEKELAHQKIPLLVFPLNYEQ